MSVKPKQEPSSGLFVRSGMIAAFLVLGLLATLFGVYFMSVMLLFLFLLMLLSRLWAAASAKRVYVSFRAENTRLFPGDSTTLRYTVKNDKALPLIWLELFQPLADSLCLTPAEEEEMRPLSEHEKFDFLDTDCSQTMIAEKRFSLLLWYQTLSWESRWVARSRGIYSLTRMRIRTGDGFGLTILGWPLEKRDCQTFAVYPAMVPVHTELFLRDLWDASLGARGYLDDVTLLRTTREYHLGDPVKQVNWRLLARQQKLSVNLYETIQPRTAHFILDSESFNGLPARDEALEECLSVLGSLLLRLQEAGVRAGLSLPKTGRYPAINLYGKDQTPTEDMLYQLAACRFCPLVRSEDGIPLHREPSVFAEDDLFASSSEIGRFYYFVHDLSAISESRLLRRLEPAMVTIVSYCNTEDKAAVEQGFDVVSLAALKGGTANAGSA